MLSKKQFNAATARLQKELTTSDLISMLGHQLTKENKDNQHSNIIEQLGALSAEFQDKTPLDRRRAENYLAKSLYGKNHSQVAHQMSGDNAISDEEFGCRSEIYGRFIRNYANQPDFKEDKIIDNYAKNIAKNLRTSSPDEFKVSYKGYCNKVDSFSYLSQYNVLMYLSFLDLNIQIEFVFIRDERDSEVEPLEEYLTFITVNEMNLVEFGKKIGCKILDLNNDDDLFKLEVLFSGVVFEMISREELYFKDFYCLDYPKELLDNHKWKLCLDRKSIAKNFIVNNLFDSLKNNLLENSNDFLSERFKNSISEALINTNRIDYSNNVLLDIEPDTYDDFIEFRTNINFFLKNSEDVISINFSHKDKYAEGNLENIIIKYNNAIISVSNNHDTHEYLWHSIIYNLKSVMPFINLLRED